jgi:hypothetical protein
MQRYDKSVSVGGMTREERKVAEQKAVDSIWGTRAYRQAVQKQPKNDDPFGTQVMFEATKSMEMGQDKRYDNLSPERRIAITSQMREEYTRRLTQVNTLEAEKRRVFNEDRDAMQGVFFANIEQASRNEEFELDGKKGRHSIEDVLQVANKYSAVLGGRLNGIQDNARAYQSIRDRADKATPATPEEHNQKARMMNQAYLGEVTADQIVNSTLRPEFKPEVLRIVYQQRNKPKTPEEKARLDQVKDLGKLIYRQLNVQTSSFVRDRYKDEDEEKVMADRRSGAITREAADYYLVQLRWIKGMRATAPSTQGPTKPAEEPDTYLGRARKFFGGGKAQARPPEPEE